LTIVILLLLVCNRFTTLHGRILAVGKALDAQIERDIASAPKPGWLPAPVKEVACGKLPIP
jgi:hypothetical protein